MWRGGAGERTTNHLLHLLNLHMCCCPILFKLTYGSSRPCCVLHDPEGTDGDDLRLPDQCRSTCPPRPPKHPILNVTDGTMAPQYSCNFKSRRPTYRCSKKKTIHVSEGVSTMSHVCVELQLNGLRSLCRCRRSHLADPCYSV